MEEVSEDVSEGADETFLLATFQSQLVHSRRAFNQIVAEWFARERSKAEAS
jgi:hypothetical protein